MAIAPAESVPWMAPRVSPTASITARTSFVHESSVRLRPGSGSDRPLPTGKDHTFGNPADHVGRTVPHPPSYAPEVVDTFVRDLRLGYVLLVPDAVAEADRVLYREEIERLLAGRIASHRTFPGGYELYLLAPTLP
jgi:hypothetical protein